MEAQCFYIGACLGFAFIAGTIFGAWMQMNSYRQVGQAIKQVVDDLEEDDAEEWE